MRVLLDENLDHRLRARLGEHEVFTVAYMGWAGLRNGELLTTAKESGIQIFLTGDKTLTLEQNLTARQIAIVVLSSIEFPIIKNNLPAIIEAIDAAAAGSLRFVECGSFSRKRPGIEA